VRTRVHYGSLQVLASGERGALEAMLRAEGIYSSQLAAWRLQFAARGESGLVSRTPGRKPKLNAKDRELLAVTKKNEVLQRKLRIANALIELQKKHTSCWDWHCRNPRRRADAARRASRS